jgi:hypothetical protein
LNACIHVPQDKLNNSPGEGSQDGVDKGAVDNRDGFDSLHGESLFDDKIPDTDSDVQFTISRTDECENSSLSQSGKTANISLNLFLFSDQLISMVSKHQPEKGF